MKGFAGSALALVLTATGLTEPRAQASLGVKPVDTLEVEAEVPRRGDFIAWGFGALWMMTGPTLVRVDAGTGIVKDFKIPPATGVVRGLAAGEGAVWIADVAAEKILKFDPFKEKVVTTISVARFSDTEGSVGVGNGSLWITTVGNKLTRFNAETGIVEALIPLPGKAPAVIFDNGSVWVTSWTRDELYKVDAKTNTVVLTVPLSSSPRFLTAGEGSIWVLNQSGSVQRVDPDSGRVIATIDVGPPSCGGDIAAGGGSIWVSLHDFPLVQIDPKVNAVVARFKGSGWGDSVRYGGGSLWMSGSSIRRLKPLR
jgi:virginiamycin B lyase